MIHRCQVFALVTLAVILVAAVPAPAPAETVDPSGTAVLRVQGRAVSRAVEQNMDLARRAQERERERDEASEPKGPVASTPPDGPGVTGELEPVYPPLEPLPGQPQPLQPPLSQRQGEVDTP